MHCQLRSADRTFFDGDASMVVAQSPHGEFAIMDGHAPLLAVVARGPIRIHTDTETRIFACRSGTLRMAGGRVVLLVESAVPIEEIELSQVRAQMIQLEESSDPARSDEKGHLALLENVKERYG